MLDHIDTLAVREIVARMSGRERELAELLLAGHSQKTAAQKMRISRSKLWRCMLNIRRSFIQ